MRPASAPLLAILVLTTASAHTTILAHGTGTASNPFRVEIAAESKSSLTVDLPPMLTNKHYFLEVNAAYSDAKNGQWEAKASCGCLKPSVKATSTSSVTVAVEIDLTGKQDRLDDKIALFSDEKFRDAIAVRAEIYASHLRFDRKRLVLNTHVAEKKPLFVFFQPDIASVSDIRSEKGLLLFEVAEKAKNHIVYLVHNRPPTNGFDKDTVIVTGKTPIGASEIRLPVQFADTSLCSPHPPVLMFGHMKIGQEKKLLFHLEKEHHAEIVLLPSKILRVERKIAERNILEYEVTFQTDTAGRIEEELWFEITSKRYDRSEQLRVPAVALIR